MTYWNDIMTLILWLDFLQHHFPEETNKLKKFASNFQIYLYSQYEVLMKRNGIDIFCEEYIEPVSIVEDNDDYNQYDEDIIKIFNKHRPLSKSKYSNNDDDNDIADDDITYNDNDNDNDIVNSNSNNIDSNIVSNNNIKIEGKEKIA